MPAWNAGRTLATTIDSVLGQTDGDLELIICDDASEDNTQDLLASCKDPRLRRLHNPSNLGEGRSRDAAISRARGQWLAVIDADDAWAPDRLEKLLAVAGNRSDVVIFDDIMECHDAPDGMVPWKRLRGETAFGARGKDAIEVTLSDYICQARLLMKPLFPTALVSHHGLHHSCRRFAADTEYFLRVIETGARLVYVPEAMYFYRITPGSMSGHPSRASMLLEVLEEAGERLSLDGPTQDAFHRKMASIMLDIRYAPFLQSLKGRDWHRTLELAIERPELVLEFVRRLPATFFYNVARLRHRAAGR